MKAASFASPALNPEGLTVFDPDLSNNVELATNF